MNEPIVLEGAFWTAGDTVFIDQGSDEAGWNITDLGEFMKKTFAENQRVRITIETLPSLKAQKKEGN